MELSEQFWTLVVLWFLTIVTNVFLPESFSLYNMVNIWKQIRVQVGKLSHKHNIYLWFKYILNT